MKILCLQLARFGDIYQTWPVLNALKRTHPGCEIHLVVRERFQAATEGFAAADAIKTLPSRAVFAPLFTSNPNVAGALGELDRFVQSLRDENYDRIINLSFSPVSSYLTELVTRAGTEVAGYTRHRDGFLAIPDDVSSYFYAQVGVDRSSRIHICDIFALVAGVELCEDDFRAPLLMSENLATEVANVVQGRRIVVHVGASQAEKVCDRETWRRILEEICSRYDGQIVLVGGPEDAARVPEGFASPRVENLVGRTRVPDLFYLLAGADAALGCDSMVIHMAGLTRTPTLNISFPFVRFWETGPRARGSRVIWFESPVAVDAARVAAQLTDMIAGRAITSPGIEKVEETGVIYQLHGYEEYDFAWELTRALYMSQPFPLTDSQNIRLGFTRLNEIARLAFEQLDAMKDKNRQSTAVEILNRIDTLVTEIARFVPEISPVTRWFQCEKLRVGPGTFEEVLEATRGVFEKLSNVCQVYQLNQAFNESLNREDLAWKP